MKIKRYWHSINQMAINWSCTIDDILHMAQTEQIQLCIDWKKLDKDFEHWSFRFIYDPSFKPTQGHLPVTNQEILFTKAISFDTNFDELFLPKSTTPLANLTACPKDLLNKLSANSVCYFDTHNSTTEETGDLGQVVKHFYEVELDLYLSDYQLFAHGEISHEEHKLPQHINITMHDLVITDEEITRLEALYNMEQKKGEIVSSIITHDFEAEEIPDSLYHAYSLFKDIWCKLPNDMNNPTKSDLDYHVKNEQGIINKALRDAIIKVSKPNDIKLGGKSKSNLKPFDRNALIKLIGD
jgi:hypothetical protein